MAQVLGPLCPAWGGPCDREKWQQRGRAQLPAPLLSILLKSCFIPHRIHGFHPAPQDRQQCPVVSASELACLRVLQPRPLCAKGLRSCLLAPSRKHIQVPPLFLACALHTRFKGSGWESALASDRLSPNPSLITQWLCDLRTGSLTFLSLGFSLS